MERFERGCRPDRRRRGSSGRAARRRPTPAAAARATPAASSRAARASSAAPSATSHPRNAAPSPPSPWTTTRCRRSSMRNGQRRSAAVDELHAEELHAEVGPVVHVAGADADVAERLQFHRFYPVRTYPTSRAVSTTSSSLRRSIVDRHRIAHEVAGEAALRAETQLIERQILRGCVDPPLQDVARLEHRRLRRHETEDDLLALRHVAERLRSRRRGRCRTP